MLIRVSGGVGGIAAYLEGGKKRGRDAEREQLDERVVLSGNLALTDAIIASMTGAGERYLHITLAFKEDEVSPEVLAEVAKEFESFAMAAYDRDEYCFYAEAHIPRIKSYTDQSSGDFVERKPHIHIVIPELNLLSGQRLDPFGLVERNSSYIDSFQEHINHRFGLASPKVHRRTDFTGQSEMIGRYTGELFASSNREWKVQLLDTILDTGICSPVDLCQHLGRLGEVSVRNPGKSNEYLNLKLEGAAKGINLKDFVFSKEFIELPTDQKRKRLASDIARKFESAGESRSTPAADVARLAEWHGTKAREVKYLNSGNRKLWQQYREADAGERQAILADRAQRFYSKHRQEKTSVPKRSRRERATDWERNFGALASGSQAQSFDSLRNLSEVELVCPAQGGAVLLPADAPGQLDIERPGSGGEPVRRRADGRGGVVPDAVGQGVARRGDSGRGNTERSDPGLSGRRSDSVLGQIARDRAEAQRQADGGALAEFVEIKRSLDARRLLEELAQSHGLLVEKYEVSRGRDGGDRIRCGARHLNVSDFLTKEMRLPWSDAATLMREAYARQRDRAPALVRPRQPRRQLWAEFQAHRQAAAQGRAVAWANQRASERDRRLILRGEFLAQRSAINGRRGGRAAERKASVAVARMRRVAGEVALRAAIQGERQALVRPGRGSLHEQYRDFLQQRAGAGDEAALGELRRMRTQVETVGQAGVGRLAAAVSGAGEGGMDEDDPKATLRRIRGWSFMVARNGDVTYSQAGRDALRDRGRAVDVFTRDDATIEAALRLAQQKFGRRLTVAGDAGFEGRVAAVAARAGLQVEFSDPRLNETVRRLLTQNTSSHGKRKRSANPSFISPLKLRTSGLRNQRTRRGGHGSTADGTVPGASGGVSCLWPEGAGMGRGQRGASGNAAKLVRTCAALAGAARRRQP